MTLESKDHKKRKWSQRYRSSLKQLQPIRSSSKEPSHLMPGPARGFISLYSLSWLTGMMWKACRDKLKPADIWTLRPEDCCHTNYVRLERHWRHELKLKGEQGASLTMTLLRTFRTRTIISIMLMLVANTLALLGPSVLLRQMILYLNDRTAPVSQALTLLALMVALRFVSIYFMSGSFGILSVFTGARASGALQMMVYQKLLRLGSASDQILGKVINICINDMDRLTEALRMVAFVVAAMFMTMYGFVVNLVYVGPWSILGFAVIIVSFFVLGSIGGMISVRRLAVVTVTDKRVTFMSEILAAIRLIKMYAWEQSFEDKIDDIRTEELTIQRGTMFLQAISNVLTPSIPVLATAVSVIGYIVSGNELRAAEAFIMFSVFNSLQMAIGTLPYGIRMITEAHVALRRVQRLLLMKDMEVSLEHCISGNAIEVVNATLACEKSYTKETKSERKKQARAAQTCLPRVISSPRMPLPPQAPLMSRLRAFSERRRRPTSSELSLDAETQTRAEVVLTGISVTVPVGRLVGVAGTVGSGKTSLLVGITGQLRVMCGAVRCAGTMAVVPQRAWIFSGTVRDNILFGRPMLPELYQRTLAVCALKPDLEMMDNGDLSEIGERGVNLSGGQKQRVNLARAVYADADIYLLDDPLSAVDSQVGQHIFQQCICGTLRDKTVVLVSHGVQYLSQCDEVLFMKDGRVAERGTHQQLLQLQGDYSQLVSCDAANQQEQPTSRPADDEGTADDLGTSGGKLTTEETTISTMGIFKNFVTYYKLCGLRGVLMIALLTLMFACCRTGTGVYLQYWIDAGDGRREERLLNTTLYNMTYTPEALAGVINDRPDRDTYTLGYVGLVAALLLIGLIKAWNSARFAVRGARRLHNRMISSLMRCKMSFFDSTPVGRILNRLSRDIDCVDNRIPDIYEFLSQRCMIVVIQMMVPILTYPYYVLVVVFIFGMYGIMWRCLVSGIRSTKYIENVERSPVLHHLTSTVGGLSVIRAYNKQRMMIDKFERLLDSHTSSLLVFRLASSWFTLRSDELGLVLLGAISAALLLLPGASPSEAGLIFSLVYDTIMVMPFLVMICSELSALMSAVERCANYTRGLDYEPPTDVAGGSLCQTWPERGAIRLESVSLRYRPDLPRVLHDLSVDIAAGQKVGIVGRTGAGKSTLISTMLRMMDLEAGRVLIDDVDITTIGLRQLRSGIAVIPQDPVLFSGTVRQNLDPYGLHEDARVWHVLERSGLKAKVARLPLQLATPVTSDGDSFSVGERQLICLARALLRRNRVLLLDEATASVDVQTDCLIQRTIHEDFSDCTVLTIAHRLNTVLGYGVIIVMDSGRIAEIGTPSELAAKPDSQFRLMLEQAGISSVSGPDTPASPTSSPQENGVLAPVDGQVPPLAQQEVMSDVTITPSPTRVKFDISDVTTSDNDVSDTGSVEEVNISTSVRQRSGVVGRANSQDDAVEITQL